MLSYEIKCPMRPAVHTPIINDKPALPTSLMRGHLLRHERRRPPGRASSLHLASLHLLLETLRHHLLRFTPKLKRWRPAGRPCRNRVMLHVPHGSARGRRDPETACFALRDFHEHGSISGSNMWPLFLPISAKTESATHLLAISLLAPGIG